MRKLLDVPLGMCRAQVTNFVDLCHHRPTHLFLACNMP